MPLDISSAPGAAQALAALRELAPQIARTSLHLDEEGAFPTAALDQLAAIGALEAFGKASDVGELLEALRLVGRANLSLGRLFEGHVNAAQLIGAYGDADQRSTLERDLAAARVFGVWNTEAAPVRIDASGRLVGAKTFATGAGWIDRAIITAVEPSGGKRMVIVDASQPARVTPGSWRVSGMKATASGAYDLTGLPADGSALLGEPGDYEREPRFSAGAWRFCAVQLGGAERVLQLLREHLAGSAAGEDPIHRARFAYAYARTRSALLWVREAAVRAENPHAGAEAITMVLMTRRIVEEAGLTVIEAAHRSIGTRSFNLAHPADMACRDLGLYLRQPAPDLAFDRAAIAFLRADAWNDDPLW